MFEGASGEVAFAFPTKPLLMSDTIPVPLTLRTLATTYHQTYLEQQDQDDLTC